MNILIGGSGFIGSTLGQSLVASGESVISLSRSNIGTQDGVQQVVLDLDTESLPASLLKDSPNVYILTGQTGPTFDAARQLASLTRILEVLRRHDCHVFFFSTALVYGNCAEPVTETTPPKPIGSYPVFKLAAEKLFQRNVSPKKLTILRLGNVYGNQKNRGFINLVIRSLLDTSSKPIALSNNGQTLRDYIFLDDVVNAVLAIKNHPKLHGIINVVSGTSYSLNEVVSAIEEVVGRKLPVTRSVTTTDEAHSIRISNQLLRDRFDYTSFTRLQDGLHQTLQHYQEALQ